jgi:hypothetical protein
MNPETPPQNPNQPIPLYPPYPGTEPAVPPSAPTPTTPEFFQRRADVPPEAFQQPTAPPPAPPSPTHRKPILIVLGVFVVIVIGLVIGVSLAKHPSKSANTTKQISSSPASKWLTISDQAGSLTALFPVKPTVTAPIIQYVDGVTYTISYLQATQDNTTYQVSYITYPSTVTLPSDPDEALNNAVKNESSSLQNGKVVTSKNITVDNNPAETFTVKGTKNNTTYYLTGQAILVDHVLYNMLVIHANTEATYAQYFLNHFGIN